MCGHAHLPAHAHGWVLLVLWGSDLQGEPNKSTLRKFEKGVPLTRWWSSTLGVPKADGTQESAFKQAPQVFLREEVSGMAPQGGTATAVKDVFYLCTCAACTWTWVHSYMHVRACLVAWENGVLTELPAFQEVETAFKCHHILLRSSGWWVGKWDGTETVVWATALHLHCFILFLIRRRSYCFIKILF